MLISNQEICVQKCASVVFDVRVRSRESVYTNLLRPFFIQYNESAAVGARRIHLEANAKCARMLLQQTRHLPWAAARPIVTESHLFLGCAV